MNDITQVTRLLDEMELRYQQQGERSVALSFSGKHTSYDLFVVCLGPLLSVMATADSRLPAGCLDEAIRLANHLNAERIAWGAFWVRPEQRALGFELALPCRAGVSREDLEMAFSAIPLNHFWPAFARVAWAGLDARQALGSMDEAPRSADHHASPGDVAESGSDLEPPVMF
jgi:hypothetical protein